MHRKQSLFIICWAMMWLVAMVLTILVPEKARGESLLNEIELARQTYAMCDGETICKLFTK